MYYTHVESYLGLVLQKILYPLKQAIQNVPGPTSIIGIQKVDSQDSMTSIVYACSYVRSSRWLSNCCLVQCHVVVLLE